MHGVRVGGLRAIGQRDLHVHGLSVAHNAERHHTPRRRLANKITELFSVFDRIAVEADHHVVLSHADFSCRCILVDHRYLSSRSTF